jgi:hypothetical protein
VPPQSSSLPAYDLWFPYTQKFHSRLHCSTNQEPIAKLAHNSNDGPYRLTIIWTNVEQLPVSMSAIGYVLEQIRISCLREEKPNWFQGPIPFHKAVLHPRTCLAFSFQIFHLCAHIRSLWPNASSTAEVSKDKKQFRKSVTKDLLDPSEISSDIQSH